MAYNDLPQSNSIVYFKGLTYEDLCGSAVRIGIFKRINTMKNVQSALAGINPMTYLYKAETK